MSSGEDVPTRRCGACGNALQADDDFCTRCGASLSDAFNVIPPGTTPLPGTDPVAATPPPLRRRSRGLVVALALVSIACVALAAATIVGRQKLTDTRSQLEASQEQVATLKASRSRLANELAAARGVSKRRAAVLLRANNVLDDLDPLLASVDALKKDTSEIQAGRSEFQDAADTAIETIITLANYLTDTDPSDIDAAYQNNLVDLANNQLDTVNLYRSQLSQSDESYSKDAAQFDTRATSLSSAVAALKKQLKQVTR